MKKARRGRRDVTTKINSTHGRRREWEFYRYPETNRGERERERVVFPWKIQNRGVALFLTNTRRKSEKGTPPILAHWNIVSVYKGGSIYIYIHRGALTCSPPGGSTNVVNRYWYWRVIFARRRRFPRLYQAWPNASGLLYHGQTIAILFAVAKDVKMDIKMRAIEGERVLAIDRKFFHGWCTCPAVDYRGMGGRERKFGNEFLIVSIVRNSPFICLAWKLLPWDETKVCFYLLPFKSRIWRAFGLEIMEIWFFICIYKMLLNFTIFCVIFFFL